MDIVVISHIPVDSKVDLDLLKKGLCVLVKAVHPNVKVVGFSDEDPLEDGSHAIQIRTPLDPDTKNQLEDGLKKLFQESFDISYGDTSHALNRKREIDRAVRQFMKTIN